MFIGSLKTALKSLNWSSSLAVAMVLEARGILPVVCSVPYSKGSKSFMRNGNNAMNHDQSEFKKNNVTGSAKREKNVTGSAKRGKNVTGSAKRGKTRESQA